LLNHQRGYYAFNTNLTNPAQYWFRSRPTTRCHTAGVKADWQAIAHKLKLGVHYTLSHGLSDMQVQATAFRPPGPGVPSPECAGDHPQRGNRGGLHLQGNMTLRAGYNVERHISDELGLSGRTTPVAQLLGSGETAPRYTAHVVWNFRPLWILSMGF